MIQSYFESEKKAGFIALAIGLTACTVASAFMISARPPFYIGLSVVFLATGIFQAIVGATMARRSDLQAFDLQKLLAADPNEFVQLESARVEKVLRNFKYSKAAGSILFLIGFFLLIFHKKEDFFSGLGCALVIQGIVINLFDRLAEQRAVKYAEYVKGIHRD